MRIAFEINIDSTMSEAEHENLKLSKEMERNSHSSRMIAEIIKLAEPLMRMLGISESSCPKCSASADDADDGTQTH